MWTSRKIHVVPVARGRRWIHQKEWSTWRDVCSLTLWSWGYPSDDGAVNENVKKAIGLIRSIYSRSGLYASGLISKTTTLYCSTLFDSFIFPNFTFGVRSLFVTFSRRRLPNCSIFLFASSQFLKLSTLMPSVCLGLVKVVIVWVWELFIVFDSSVLLWWSTHLQQQRTIKLTESRVLKSVEKF